MQSSSTNTQLADVISVVDSYLASADVESVEAPDVVGLLTQLIPVVRRLQMHQLSLASRGVDCNVHNSSDSRSAGAWLGSLLGVREKAAARQLGTLRLMQASPDVLELC